MARRRPFPGWVLPAAVPLLLWAMPALADPVAPSVMVPALNLYVDSIAAGHYEAAACTPANSPARDEAGWAKAKAVLIATLWANGFPADFVGGAETRLDAPAPAAKPDCDDKAVFANFGEAFHQGWPATIGDAIHRMDLTPVDTPVSADQWQAIKAAIAAELPLEARGFDCLGATMPGLLLVAVHDWDAQLIKIGGKLAAAGLPRDEVAATLSAAEANSLWHRAAPDALAALVKSCDDDKTWQDRFFNLESLSLGDTIDKLLPPQPPDADNN